MTHDPPLSPEERHGCKSLWFKYRCRSCDHTDWVEDICAYAFPPEKPGGTCVAMCPECGEDFAKDESIEPTESFNHNDSVLVPPLITDFFIFTAPSHTLQSRV